MTEFILALSVFINLIFVFYSRWLINILKTRMLNILRQVSYLVFGLTKW